MSESELKISTQQGQKHALSYPVAVTGVLIPYAATKAFMDAKTKNPLRLLIERFLGAVTGIKSFDHLMKWLGLHSYPDQEGEYGVFYPNGHKPDSRMGESIIPLNNTEGWTVSCAACHASDVFGKKILGLQNRFPRANEFFIHGKLAMSLSHSQTFKWITGATDAETQMFKRSKKNLRFVDAKKPVQLGLDTSLAHVALSLARREQDSYATKNKKWVKKPREEPLKTYVADSKPGTWWNVKFKNKWLLDGSVVSGNPIFTNILWNEIGRGTDLKELENWLSQNTQIITDLTNAVFNSQSPRIEEFIDISKFNIESAKRGEKLFLNRCTKCHGHYEKAWSHTNTGSIKDLIQTTRVEYFQDTPIIDVGTDPQRYLGMNSLMQLNKLAISINNNIEIQTQKGYVPPPLVGIWIRWPYFHNNSVPTLCDVLRVSDDRPANYWAGPAENPKTDFDWECNGYPKTPPKKWMQSKKYFYDTKKPGLSNKGHDKNMQSLTENDRLDLVRFLQTL